MQIARGSSLRLSAWGEMVYPEWQGADFIALKLLFTTESQYTPQPEPCEVWRVCAPDNSTKIMGLDWFKEPHVLPS